jgi:SAM-dependent methyltransferase
MNVPVRLTRLVLAATLASSVAFAQEKPFEPYSGQAGKDVVWVPSPDVTVQKMMDVAKIGPQDFVMDLGSGDGRNIIAAAKRGARALGVEFNPQMVELSRRSAQQQGVGDKAQFVEGDMFTADLSKATALALFLLPDNLRRLDERFQALPPGTRIVVNTFGIAGWTPEETTQAEGNCGAWCSVILYLVPAKVAGTWKMPQGELVLEQKVQEISGNIIVGGKKLTLVNGRMSGDQMSFSAGGVLYTARVSGDSMEGKGPAGPFSATRVK